MDWPAARNLAYTSASLLPAIEMPVHRGLGTTLAEPLVAKIEHPPHDTSAMDGYAVAGSAPWRMRGRILAGQAPRRQLCPGEAVEIATGAMVPAGAEAVALRTRRTRR